MAPPSSIPLLNLDRSASPRRRSQRINPGVSCRTGPRVRNIHPSASQIPVPKPPNQDAIDVFRTLSTLEGQLHMLNQRRVAERLANSAQSSDAQASTPADCAICLDILTSPESVITQCGHVFHEACLRKCPGFHQRPISCPACRRPVHKAELVTVRNGLPQKVAPPVSGIFVADDPCQLTPDRSESIFSTSREQNNSSVVRENVMDLVSDDDEPLAFVATRRHLSIGSDVVEVPVSTSSSGFRSGKGGSSCPSCSGQSPDSEIESELKHLLKMLKTNFRAGIAAYEKASVNLQEEYLQKATTYKRKYELRKRELDERSQTLDTREVHVSANEMRIRKKFEEVEALKEKHNEGIADINEEKGRLAYQAKNLKREKEEIEMIRGRLSETEHQLRTKELRVGTLMKAYKQKQEKQNSAVAREGMFENPSRLTEPKSSLEFQKNKRSSNSTPNSIDEVDDIDDGCIVEAVNQTLRSNKLRLSETSSTVLSPLNPIEAFGGKLFVPKVTNIPTQPIAFRKTDRFKTTSKAPSLSSFHSRQVAKMKPLNSIGKLPRKR